LSNANAEAKVKAVGNYLRSSWGLWAACALAFAVYAPTLGYHLSFDDLVPLSDMATAPFAEWMMDVLRLQDATPSWRPLTMLVYRIEYAVFGMNAAGFRTVNLAVHIVNVAMVYIVTMRLVRRSATAMLVAVGFGVFGGAWDTVSYVTALPHVLALALFLVSLWLLLEFVQTGQADNEIYWGSFAFFVLAFLANEASVTLLVPYALGYLLVAPRPIDLVRIGKTLVPFALVALAFGLVFSFCPCRDQMSVEQRWEWITLKQAWLYLAWMFIPVGEAPYEFDVLQWVAGGVAIAALALTLARGAPWARWAVASLIVFLMPYVLIEPIIAGETVVLPRYVYAAAFPFLLILAWCADFLLGRVKPVHLARTCLAAIAIAAILGYSVETAVQNRKVLQVREPAQRLVSELEAHYRKPPFGQRIFLLGEPWTNPFFAFAGIPAVARLVFGDPPWVSLEAWDPTILDTYLKGRDYRLEPWEHVLRYEDGEFVELTADQVKEEAERIRSAATDR
jgi:hypothetical protein